MRPIRNQAREGLFANFIPKAGHHNTFAPSQGEHFLVSFVCLQKKLGRPSENGLKISAIAIAIQNKRTNDQNWMAHNRSKSIQPSFSNSHKLIPFSL